MPALHHYDKKAGLLYLEDFGDLTLAQACLNQGKSQIEKLYSMAVDALVQIHLDATSSADTTCLAFSRAFDESLLMWEFDHFLEYGVVARRGKPMCSVDERVVRTVFREIAEWLARQPRVFTHRDYHSRNLMVDGNRLGIIDFQDALMGPVTYDLASLLRDSYIGLDDELINSMIDRYIERMCKSLDTATQEAMLLKDRSAFRRLFDLTSIQRNLKAAGRFMYIDRVKNNPKFLSGIPRTLGYVRQNLERYPELESLKKCLTPYVSEWQ